MKRIVSAIMPPFIKKPLVRRLCANRALKEDCRLKALGVGLEEEQMENLKVLPGRKSLLEALPKQGTVAEVGVAEGDFSQQILEICRPAQLHLIDYWKSSIREYGETGYQRVSNRFSRQVSSGQVALRRGWSWEMLGELPDQSLDWVYIDASHRYDDVKKDLLAAKPKLKPEGILAGHDYVKWSSQAGRFGVVEAVNEFCVAFHYEMIYLTLQRDMHLSYAIRRAQGAS